VDGAVESRPDRDRTAIAGLGRLKFFPILFGDSSYIVHFLSWVGYRLSPVVQTGSNFGCEVMTSNPFLTRIGSGTMVADGLNLINDEVSSTSFRASQVTIGPNNFLGNFVTYPSGGRTALPQRNRFNLRTIGIFLFTRWLGVFLITVIDVGDECVFNYRTMIQCDSQEDGTYKSGRSTLGAGCTIGVGAFVHYGVTMGDRSVLAADSFLRKGEYVPAHARWEGNPAREM
jgi:acetyltransferase-like isoleucine patch superfamily enzyme